MFSINMCGLCADSTENKNPRFWQTSPPVSCGRSVSRYFPTDCSFVMTQIWPRGPTYNSSEARAVLSTSILYFPSVESLGNEKSELFYSLLWRSVLYFVWQGKTRDLNIYSLMNFTRFFIPDRDLNQFSTVGQTTLRNHHTIYSPARSLCLEQD